MSLYALGLFGAAVCCLSMLVSEASPVLEEIPLEYGSLPVRRPPKFGILDLLNFLLGVFIVGGVHLAVLRQARLVWSHMEAMRILLEEIENKLKDEAAMMNCDKDLLDKEAESLFEKIGEFDNDEDCIKIPQFYSNDIISSTKSEDCPKIIQPGFK